MGVHNVTQAKKEASKGKQSDDGVLRKNSRGYLEFNHFFLFSLSFFQIYEPYGIIGLVKILLPWKTSFPDLHIQTA